MDWISPDAAGVLADAILLFHAGLAAFVVAMLPLVLIGGRCGWRWVRRRGLRGLHLLLIVYIAGQAWLGELCPLTRWEQALRERAGEPGYGDGFIEHWLSRLLFFEAPWEVFIAGYTLFAAAVAFTWYLVPPERRRR
jgi:hypothetical protein